MGANQLFAILIFLFLNLQSIGQVERCNSNVEFEWLQTNALNRYQRFIDLENFTQNYSNNQGQYSNRLINGNGVIVIPIVVHVLHRGEAEGTGYNISMTTIQSQIDVLNEDFRRLNADAINTPSVFQSLASDFGIEFKLACIDPNDNSTNGVVRKYTPLSSFSTFNKLRPDKTIDDDAVGIKTATNGSVAWNTERYLNIWVCNLEDLLGYGTWPADYSVYPQFDGIVVGKNAFGRNGGTLTGFDKGRTATHEIGHWLNLFHLWGDEANNNLCTLDDLVGDTPQQKGNSIFNIGGAPTFPELTLRCNTSDPSIMFMNYMDYVNDNIYNLFTIGQKLRARALFALGGPREQQLNNWFKVHQYNTPIQCNGFIYSSPICSSTNWTLISGPATLTPVAGTNKTAITATGVGTVRVRAESGNYFTEDDIEVSNLPPLQPSAIDVILIDQQLGRIEVAIDEVQNANTYNWYKNGVLVNSFHSNWAKIPIPRGVCDLDYGISVEAINDCGTSAAQFKLVYVFCEEFFRVSPNPAISQILVTVQTGKNGSGKTISGIKVYDQQGSIKKSIKCDKVTQVSVYISDLHEGAYIVEISAGTFLEKKKILVHKN